jgi:hypothetical protein
LSSEKRKGETSSPETFEALDETLPECTQRRVHDRRTDEMGRYMRRDGVGLVLVLVVRFNERVGLSGDGVERELGV